MEIIKKGSVPEKKDEVYELTCNKCGTVFRFKRSEGKEGHHPSGERWVEINCPVCKKPAFKYD